MTDDTADQPEGLKPANDNGAKPDEGNAGTEVGGDSAPSRKVDRLVLDVARLIGRQMARDDFERLVKSNANDNGNPWNVGDGDGGPSKD